MYISKLFVCVKVFLALLACVLMWHFSSLLVKAAKYHSLTEYEWNAHHKTMFQSLLSSKLWKSDKYIWETANVFLNIIYWRINTDEPTPINMNKAADTGSFLNGVRFLVYQHLLYIFWHIYVATLYTVMPPNRKAMMLYILSMPWMLCEKCSSWPKCMSADPR